MKKKFCLPHNKPHSTLHYMSPMFLSNKFPSFILTNPYCIYDLVYKLICLKYLTFLILRNKYIF